MRCRHAFETVCVHANGDVVCSIIDGRGDFVLGNVAHESLERIFMGERSNELRRLVLSTEDTYCRAIGKHCPLKTTPVSAGEIPEVRDIRFLQIELTTACDLRCLSCPVRDFDSSIGWRDAYRDGGAAFFAWDATRRLKQHSADILHRHLPALTRTPVPDRTPAMASLLRGRVPEGRNGTLSLETVTRVLETAGPHIERIDFYNYGEPFLYRPLVAVLSHARAVLPSATLVISTDGQQIREAVEDSIIEQGLLDWLVFSIDGCDAESYGRYRIRGSFDKAMANLARVHRKATGRAINVIWQYVVFRWNDRDDQLRRAMDMAAQLGVTIWFDFARSTWGRSQRKPDRLQYLVPFLRPDTTLPTWT